MGIKKNETFSEINNRNSYDRSNQKPVIKAKDLQLVNQAADSRISTREKLKEVMLFAPAEDLETFILKQGCIFLRYKYA